MSYDRMAYVWNNPLMASDPSGEFILTALAIIGALAVTSGLVRVMFQILCFTNKM